jgi:hypothetical protein
MRQGNSTAARKRKKARRNRLNFQWESRHFLRWTRRKTASRERGSTHAAPVFIHMHAVSMPQHHHLPIHRRMRQYEPKPTILAHHRCASSIHRSTFWQLASTHEAAKFETHGSWFRTPRYNHPSVRLEGRRAIAAHLSRQQRHLFLAKHPPLLSECAVRVRHCRFLHAIILLGLFPDST